MIDVPTRVKDALRDGRRLKEYRFVVLKSDGTADFTIDNDYLVKESVKFDERMVTGKELKFGLCEGSSLEFQYFNKPNINGKQIQAFIDVQYKDADGTLKWQTIPMGWFTVDQCPMQFSTGIYKVTAYNKLKSEYLDAKANELLIQDCGNPNLSLSVYDIQTALLNDYRIDQSIKVDVQVADHLYAIMPDGLSAKLTDNMSDLTPINYYNLFETGGQAWNTTFYLTPRTYGWRYTVDPSKYYTIQTDFDLAEWEEDFIDYVSTLIGTSYLNKSPSDYLNYIANTATGRWRNMMAIVITYSDNTEKLYSDAAYARGIATGAFGDIINKSITNATEIVWYQCVQIAEGTTASGPGVYGNQHFDGENYQYKKRSTMGTYRTFKFPNGDDMPIYGSGGSVTPVPYWFHCYELQNLTDAEKITMQPLQMPDFTLRDIISANYETVCQYGKLDRTTDLFSGIELNQSFLYPADNLYPSDTLYPSGIAESSFKSQYSKLWTDMVGEQSFRNLIITYKGTIVDPDTQQTSEGDKTITKVVNANGTTDYIMDNNWLFKNLLWSDQDVEDYADAMVLKMQSIKWFPFEMWGAGLPYIESGDMIEISDREGNTYTTYILQRQLEGIQNLQDTYINGELDIF